MRYESRKENDIIIRVFCCNIDDMLSSEEVKGCQFDLDRKHPLQLYEGYIKYEIIAPTMGGGDKRFGEGSTREEGKGNIVQGGYMYHKTSIEGGELIFNTGYMIFNIVNKFSRYH